jgi:hypothetical protein
MIWVRCGFKSTVVLARIRSDGASYPSEVPQSQLWRYRPTLKSRTSAAIASLGSGETKAMLKRFVSFSFADESLSVSAQIKGMTQLWHRPVGQLASQREQSATSTQLSRLRRAQDSNL